MQQRVCNKGFGMSKAERPYVGQVEAIEPRRLLAFQAVGGPGVLQATGVTAVESAAARPDTTNMYRYASWVNTNGTGDTDAVFGTDSSAPGTPIAIPSAVNATVSNTDVASNFPSLNRYVVVWQETLTNIQTGLPSNNVYAQVYNNNVAVGNRIAMGGATAGNQTDCRVAMDAAGDFTVVWQGTIGNSTQVYAQQFASDGSVSFATVQISGNATPNTLGNGVEPDVAMNSTGEVAITYVNNSQTIEESFEATTGGNGTAGTIGQAIGTPNVVTNQTFTEPAIGIADDGTVTVAWSATVGGMQQIEFSQYDNTGMATSTDVVASDDTSLNQNVPELAVDTSGGFAIGWAQASTGTNYDEAVFRVFDRTATPNGTEFVISGVSFAGDFRFGLAHRVPNQVNVAYASAGEALMQTYAQSTGGNEIPPAADSAVIDISGSPSSVVEVFQTSTQFQVYVNGVLTTYSRSIYNSIYVKGSVGNDFIRMNTGVTVPTTIYGEDGNDTIRGSAGADYIDAGPGNDAVEANDGNDYVLGGDGDDTLFGGGGDDRLVGGGGKNVYYGEDGNDTLVGGTSAEVFYGGAGDDSILGGAGGDYIDGGTGNDTLFGGDGNDVIFGNNGNDYISGDAGNDSLHGGRGNDTVLGGNGNDTLYGDANADFINGGFGTNYGYYDTLDTIQHLNYRIIVI